MAVYLLQAPLRTAIVRAANGDAAKTTLPEQWTSCIRLDQPGEDGVLVDIHSELVETGTDEPDGPAQVIDPETGRSRPKTLSDPAD